MSKTYLIETRQTYIIGYAVVMDDDMDPKTIAGKIIADGELPKELYQYDAGEKFEQCIPLLDGQVVGVFKAKNDYLAALSDQEIEDRFVMDFRTKED